MTTIVVFVALATGCGGDDVGGRDGGDRDGGGVADGGLDATCEGSCDADLVDAAEAGLSDATDGAPVDAAEDASSEMCLTDPERPYRRFCGCSDAGGRITVACGPPMWNACYVYDSTCTDIGFVACEPANYARHAGLREACESFCDRVRAGDPEADCFV